MKLIFTVLDVSLTMGLTRCYKTEGFFTFIEIWTKKFRYFSSDSLELTAAARIPDPSMTRTQFCELLNLDGRAITLTCALS